MRQVVICVAVAVALVGAEPVAMPEVVGLSVYVGAKQLRRLGLEVRFQQTEQETAAAGQFLIVSQQPDSGAPVSAGDTVVLQFNCTGMLCYWQDWVVPLLGDFAHNVSPAKATVRPVAVLLPDAEYPAALRGTGFAGTAGVEALVDYDGSVVAARVRQSSGAAAADSAACAAALGSSFSKAECYGAACRVWVTIPYTWEHVEKEDLKSSKPSQLYDESRDRY